MGVDSDNNFTGDKGVTMTTPELINGESATCIVSDKWGTKYVAYYDGAWWGVKSEEEIDVVLWEYKTVY